jgi:hypothetical protein
MKCAGISLPFVHSNFPLHSINKNKMFTNCKQHIITHNCHSLLFNQNSTLVLQCLWKELRTNLVKQWTGMQCVCYWRSSIGHLNTEHNSHNSTLNNNYQSTLKKLQPFLNGYTDVVLSHSNGIYNIWDKSSTLSPNWPSVSHTSYIAHHIQELCSIKPKPHAYRLQNLR